VCRIAPESKNTSRIDWCMDVDLRGTGTLIRHKLRFDIPLPTSTASDHRNPDKAQLLADILIMREQGMSYREIGAALGIHWTRVGQILKIIL